MADKLKYLINEHTFNIIKYNKDEVVEGVILYSFWAKRESSHEAPSDTLTSFYDRLRT